MRILTDLERDKLLKKNINKYKRIFKNIDEDKKTFIEKLYVEAAFMEQTLFELQERIKEEGAVKTFTNGNGFEVVQEHPASKTYNTMIRNYNGIIKTLIEHIPEDAEEDEFTKWLDK